MKTVVFHPEAATEFDAAIAYYEAQSLGLGVRLGREVERVISAAAGNPEGGAPYEDSAFRFRLVKTFRFVVYYLDDESILWIAAVAHGHRRPGYWRHRFEN